METKIQKESKDKFLIHTHWLGNDKNVMSLPKIYTLNVT
jgi:hypothetical protein